MRYFLGLVKCPKVGRPDTLVAHKGKKVGKLWPAQPNRSAAYGWEDGFCQLVGYGRDVNHG